MSLKILQKSPCEWEFDIEDVISEKNLKFDFLLEKDRSVYREEFLSEGSIISWRMKNTKEGEGTKDIKPINEASYREVIKMADAPRRKRAKNGIYVRYEGVTNSRGWIKFSTNSQRIPGKRYTQYIKLKEAKDMRKFREFNQREIVRLFMTGDIQCWCSCPDFKYRKQYLAYNLGFGLFKESRFPKIRNPRLEGSVCKHLICVLQTFPMNHTSIERDMVRTKFFKARYFDKEDELSDLDKSVKRKSRGTKKTV